MVGHYVINRFDISDFGNGTSVNPEQWAENRRDITGLLCLIPDDLYELEEALFVEAV